MLCATFLLCLWHFYGHWDFLFFFLLWLQFHLYLPIFFLMSFFRKFAMWLLYCVYVQMKEKAVMHKDGGLDSLPRPSLLQLICTCPRGPFLFSPLHKFSIQEPRRPANAISPGVDFHGCSCSSPALLSRLNVVPLLSVAHISTVWVSCLIKWYGFHSPCLQAPVLPSEVHAASAA